MFDFRTPWHSTRFAQDCLFIHCMVIEPVDETSTSDLLWSPWAGGHAWRKAHVFVDDARVGEDRGPNIIRTASRSIWSNTMSVSEAFKIKREIRIRRLGIKLKIRRWHKSFVIIKKRAGTLEPAAGVAVKYRRARDEVCGALIWRLRGLASCDLRVVAVVGKWWCPVWQRQDLKSVVCYRSWKGKGYCGVNFLVVFLKALLGRMVLVALCILYY